MVLHGQFVIKKAFFLTMCVYVCVCTCVFVIMIALTQCQTLINELTALDNIKSAEEQFVQAYRETSIKKQQHYNGQIHRVIYTYNQQTKGNYSARQTRTQHLNLNIPNHKHSKIHQVKEYPITLSTNIQIIQLTLPSIHTQQEN